MRVRAETVDDVLARANGRQLVILARDAHRYAWEQEAIQALVARSDDAIVVELGLPYWKPEGVSAYITTYGAGRVNVEAAAKRLSAPSSLAVTLARRCWQLHVAPAKPDGDVENEPRSGETGEVDEDQWKIADRDAVGEPNRIADERHDPHRESRSRMRSRAGSAGAPGVAARSRR